MNKLAAGGESRSRILCCGVVPVTCWEATKPGIV